MAKKKFTQLPTADALTGEEIVAVVQSGASKQTTAQDIADLGGGGSGTVESVTGDGVGGTATDPVISFPNLSETIDKGGQIIADRVIDVTGTANLTINANASALQFQGNGGIELSVGSDADGDMYRRAAGNGILERRTPAQVLGDIGAQASLGFTPENVANKATDFSTIDNTKYPTTQAVQTEIIARVAGLAWKAPVTCATTANITLSGEQTIDGVSTSAVRVLVKNQSTQSQNGIYVSAAGAWSRASDADTGTELHGATVTVQQGTSNADTTWVQTTDGITIGSSNIVWTQFGSSVPDASSSVKGIAKLYTATGSGTDGAMDQNSATNAFQAKDATLTALAGLATGANKVPYSTGTDTFGQLDLDTDGTLAANSDTKLSSQKATKTYVDAAAALKANLSNTFNRQTASYTLVLSDAGKIVEQNVASANNLTVPLNSSVAFPVGTEILISQYGAGQVTVVATGGVTIRSRDTALKLVSQYSAASLVKVGTDEWYLWGDITT